MRAKPADKQSWGNRVANGKGAGQAVLQALDAKGEARYSAAQVDRLVAAIEGPCRDVEG